MLEIIEFDGDKKIVIHFMEQLHEFLMEMDPLKRIIKGPNYGEIYVDDLLKKIAEKEGKIYVAKLDNVPVGIIAGIIEQQDEVDKVTRIKSKIGEIIELIVDKKCRGKKVGAFLMNKMEEYFRSKKCDTAWVDVFVPNQNAHEFYKKFNYQDRMIGMIKKL